VFEPWRCLLALWLELLTEIVELALGVPELTLSDLLLGRRDVPELFDPFLGHLFRFPGGSVQHVDVAIERLFGYLDVPGLRPVRHFQATADNLGSHLLEVQQLIERDLQRFLERLSALVAQLFRTATGLIPVTHSVGFSAVLPLRCAIHNIIE
jgi:hypothetical protein